MHLFFDYLTKPAWRVAVELGHAQLVAEEWEVACFTTLYATYGLSSFFFQMFFHYLLRFACEDPHDETEASIANLLTSPTVLIAFARPLPSTRRIDGENAPCTIVEGLHDVRPDMIQCVLRKLNFRFAADRLNGSEELDNPRPEGSGGDQRPQLHAV